MERTKEKKLLTIREALEIIPLSKAGIYKACADGTIKTVRIGRRVFINSKWLEDMLTLDR